jgi:hypothetical protein
MIKRKITKEKEKTLTIEKVWRVFSPFIKDVISSVHGNKCCTCTIHKRRPVVDLSGQNRQLGHFRMKKAYPRVRWWILNLNLQCSYCNGFLNGAEIEHAEYIRRTHGEEVLEEVIRLSNERNFTIGQYEYKYILDRIKFYKKRLKDRKMKYKDVYHDIINTKFGLNFP